MIKWLISRNGAIALSVMALLSELWRGFLDAMFVLPSDFGDAATMRLAAVIFTVVFAGWAWALLAAWQGSHRGLVAANLINGLMLLAAPVGWLFFYCPAECRAEAGIFNLANTLNLVLGLLAAAALALQLRQRPQAVAEARG